MSFGFSAGDLVTVVQLAGKLRRRFIDSPDQFKAISDESDESIFRSIVLGNTDKGISTGPRLYRTYFETLKIYYISVSSQVGKLKSLKAFLVGAMASCTIWMRPLVNIKVSRPILSTPVLEPSRKGYGRDYLGSLKKLGNFGLA